MKPVQAVVNTAAIKHCPARITKCGLIIPMLGIYIRQSGLSRHLGKAFSCQRVAQVDTCKLLIVQICF
jgi:hypothetical protein